MSHLLTDPSLISPSRAPSCTHSDILASTGISTALPSEISFQLWALQVLIQMRDYKVTSPCCSPPPIIYLLLSVCVQVWCTASFTCMSSKRERWTRLNSLLLQRDSKRRATVGSYRTVNVVEKVSLSSHSARTSDRLKMKWSYFLQTWVRVQNFCSQAIATRTRF